MTVKEAKEVLDQLPKASFKNEHGEEFTIYSNGIFVLMGGDEVNAMVDSKHKRGGVMGLFNEHFNIWSPLELYLLGEALKELGEQHMSREDFEFIEANLESEA